MRHVAEGQLDYSDILSGDIIDAAPTEPRAELTMDSFVKRGLTFGFPHFDRVYSKMTIANMMFTTVRMAAELKKACETANIPPPLVFLDKHLDEKQIGYIIDEVIRTKGQTNIALVTGVKELADDHERNFFKLFDRIEREAAKTLGADFKLQIPICLDIPNAYIPKVADSITLLSQKFPNLPIIAGNVATGDIVPSLIDAGAYGIKVGIGPGAMCTTRLVTGVGVPQLTAINNAVQGLKGREGAVIGDGGIRKPRNVIEGLIAGADAMMSASIFGGTDETIEYGRTPVYYTKAGEPWTEGSGPKHFLVAGSSSSVARARTGENSGIYVPQDGEGRIAVAECIGSVVPFFLDFSQKLLDSVPEHIDVTRAQFAHMFDPANYEGVPTAPPNLDSFMLWPSIPNPPAAELAVARRNQVNLTVTLSNMQGTTTLQTTPLLLRPADIEGVLASLRAASSFATDVNGELNLKNGMEKPVAVIIPASLRKEELGKVLKTLDALPANTRPLIVVEFTEGMANVCYNSTRGNLLVKSNAAILKGFDERAVRELRSRMGKKGFIAAEVSSLDELAQARLGKADALIMAAADETTNLDMLSSNQHDRPALHRGLKADAYSGDLAKLLALVASAAELPITKGATENQIRNRIRDMTGGLRSAATFCGYHSGNTVLDALHQTPMRAVWRLVCHLHHDTAQAG